MKNNLNKYTRAELIALLESNNIEKLEQPNTKIKTEASIKNKEVKTSDLILDILVKVRNLFLSLTVITILLKIFKQYKSIRAVLKVANYIVLAVFGLSIFEAFGIFITKGEKIKTIKQYISQFKTISNFPYFLVFLIRIF